MAKDPPAPPPPNPDEEDRFKLGRKSWEKEAGWIGDVVLDPEWSDMFTEPTPEKLPAVIVCPYCKENPCTCET
jgi:hypothetical protein